MLFVREFEVIADEGGYLAVPFDMDCSDGCPTKLEVIGEGCTTVEQVQSAFNRVRLPEPGVYGKALREALYGRDSVFESKG